MTNAPAENQPDPDPDSDPPLRPVDWDGSFSHASNARLADQVGDEAAARQAAEWDREALSRLTRELLDEALTEREAGKRNAEAGEQPAPDRSTDARPPADDGRQSLFDRLESFGRPTDDGSEETR